MLTPSSMSVSPSLKKLAMSNVLKVVFATENPGKLHEVNQFACEYDIEIVSPSQAGLKPVEVEETGSTYEENARLKVEAYLAQAAAKSLIICGDDTGVEIDALHGEPGLHTRRWLGHTMSDDEIVGYVLGRLHKIEEAKRTAHFTSVVAYCEYSGPILFKKGTLEGRIAMNVMPEAVNQTGFPFERLFMVGGLPEIPLWRFKDMKKSERNEQLSHREAAFKQVFEVLKRQN